ncbi:hypothetical protein LTR08_005410 [Meristemomyces frigidus]|nr:hypothetical protein LTR08_005410 [Meristemomyces frigidus]
MAAFNLSKLRANLADYIPQTLPRLPSWPSAHASMNPDDDTDTAADTAPTDDSPPPPMHLADPSPLPPAPKTNRDLLDACDNFPYHQTDPRLFRAHTNTYYRLHVAAHPTTPLGYILPSVAQVFHGLPDWHVDDSSRSLTLVTADSEAERSRAVALTTQALRRTGHFRVLEGWRGELYPVYGARGELLFSVERAASALFGVVSYGCHMTAYTLGPVPTTTATTTTTTTTAEDTPSTPPPSSPSSETAPEPPAPNPQPQTEMLLWIPRRSPTKQTYPSHLDNTVAGGIATGESPLETLLRESAEEASLPAAFVRAHAKAAGTVSYFHIRDARADEPPPPTNDNDDGNDSGGGGGGEVESGGKSAHLALLQPECQYIYDLLLPPSAPFTPHPNDAEVASFTLMTVPEVQLRLSRGEFKPNSALVLLDFFVRHGVITAETEAREGEGGGGGLAEICARLHRRLGFGGV